MSHPSDLALGSFSAEAPWEVDLEQLTWRRSISSLRSTQQARIPSLSRPPRLPPLRRGIRVLSDLGWQVIRWKITEQGTERSRAGISRRLRESAERLGPTYIKLLQIISAGEGLFPAELVAECKKCRDQVPAVDYATVADILEQELGRPLHEVFTFVEPTPIAAASIAQVHRAQLRSGEDVVVKVQRPGIDKAVYADLQVLAWIAPFLVGRIPVTALANPPALVELFAETIVEELDFRLEADNMLAVASVFAKLDQRGFVVPRPHPEWVRQRVLVMERLVGFNFDDIDAMKEAGIDTHAVIKTGMLGFLEGAFLHGVFHGDLHGGNLFVLADGTTGLVDFGITGRLSEQEQLAFLNMMMSAMTNNVKGQMMALRDLGALPPDADIDRVISDLGLDGPPLDPTSLEPHELVEEMQRVLKSLLGYGARLPKPLMLYVKNLIFLDGAIARLAPELDMFAVVTEIATHFAVTHGPKIAEQLGIANQPIEVDTYSIKAGFGVDPDKIDQLTYADLQARRALISKRLTGRSID